MRTREAGAAYLLHHSVVVAAGALMLLWLAAPLLGTKKNMRVVSASQGLLLGKPFKKVHTFCIVFHQSGCPRYSPMLRPLEEDVMVTEGHSLLGLCGKSSAILDSTSLF